MSFDPYEFDRGYASSQRDTIGQYTAKTFLWMMLGLLVTFGVAVGCPHCAVPCVCPPD